MECAKFASINFLERVCVSRLRKESCKMAPVKIRRDEYEEKYYIPKQWMYGQIIGKKGRTLEQIKERSGLHHIYMDINHGSVGDLTLVSVIFFQVLLACWRSEIDQTW